MVFRVRVAAMLLPCAAAVAVASCGLDKLTASNSDGFPTSLEGFAVSGDTVVVVGDSTLLSANLPAAVADAGTGVVWTTDNATIATVGANGRVRGVNPGTTQINAVVSSPSLGEPVVKSHTVRVRFNTIGFLPIDSIGGLGGAWRLWAFGTNSNGTRHSFIDPVFDLPAAGDAAILGLNTNALGALANTCTPPAAGFCRVVARTPGTATVRMTHNGLTATTTVKVIQVPTRVAFGQTTLTISGIGLQATNAITVFDRQDQVIPAPVVTYTSRDPDVATVNAAGLVTGVRVGTTTIIVNVGLITDGFLARVVIPGPPARLRIRDIPNTLTAGQNIPNVAVEVVDVDGNVVPSASHSITLAQGAGPAGSLVGSLTASAVNGVATFSPVRLRFTGSQSITATAAGLTASTSNLTTVTSAPAVALAFTTQPANGTQAAPLSPVRVSVIDSIGNVVTTATNSIALSIGTNPGGSTLTGGGATAAVAGVATFSNLQLNNLGSGYTLNAAATGLASTTSTAFAIVGPASRLAFFTQPAAGSEAGVALPSFQVQVQDASGNLVGNSTIPVTLTLNNSCGAAGTLQGTVTVNAVSGVATFNAARLRQSCGVYRLNATATGLTAGVSATFAVVPGTPTQFNITNHPTTPMTAGCCNFVAAQIQDSLGNVNTATAVSVTVSLGTNPTGAVMTGTLTKSSTSGSVNFNDLSITKSGTGYRFALAATGMTTASSNTFDVQPGSANKLVFITNPSATVKSGSTVAPPLIVEVQDFFDNVVPGYSGTVDMSRRRQDFGGTSVVLGGTLSVTVTSGRATFSDLVLTGVEGNPLVLVASVPGGALNNGVSSTFTVVP